MKFYKIIVIALVLLQSFCVNARWAEYKDADYSRKLLNYIDIEADGLFTSVSKIKFKVLNESGRAYFADYRHYYNNSVEKLEILRAECKTKGKTYKVDINRIEDKPIASSQKSFDQNNQILIAFPNVEVGSEIFLEYRIKVFKTFLANNYFDEMYCYGYIEKNSEANINSKIPLYINVNNPKNALEIKETKKNGLYSLKITTKKPIFDAVISETGMLNPDQGHYVQLSSIKDWGKLTDKIAPNYENVINQKLPYLFEQIAKEAKKIKNPIDQINKVTSMLNEKVQYMGDWRSIEGRYFPRDLSEIASSQIGDCKDFASSAAAILKVLGYNTQAALVFRGYPYDSKNKLYNMADPYIFNHAILRAIDAQGKIYWIDPTNVVSMAQNIFPDISSRPSLILDSKSPELSHTDSIDYKNSIYISNLEISINKKNMIADVSGSIDFKGLAAKNLTSWGLFESQQKINDSVFFKIAGRNLPDGEKKFIKFSNKLTSRIVEDLNIKFAYIDKNLILKNDNFISVPVENFSYSILNDADGQISNLTLSPYIDRQLITIKNQNSSNLRGLNHKIHSKWIDYTITAENAGKDIKVEQNLIIKVLQITALELKSPEYIKLKEDLMKLGKSFMINLNN